MDRYLTERAKCLLNATDNQRIEELENESIIEHPLYVETTNRMQKLFLKSPKRGMDCMMIVGPTGMGKTQLLVDFEESHPPFRDEEGELQRPVVYVTLNSGPSAKRFFTRLVTTLKIPISLTSMMPALEATVLNTLKAYKTRMIIIDEIQNVENALTKNQKVEFLNLLRDLNESLQIPVVVCGIEDSLMALNSDGQLGRRFHPLVTIPKWEFSDIARNLLADFEATLPLRKPSNLHETMLATQILEMSEGLTGYIGKLIRQAAIKAIQTETEAITADLLTNLEWKQPRTQFSDAANEFYKLIKKPRSG